MDNTIQHFVSQRLGRGVGSVNLDQDGNGSVQIALSAADAPSFTYCFNAAAIAARYPDKSDLFDTVVRIAIGQTHRDIRKHVPGAAPQPLSTAVLPWLGDLTAAPYGGATVGFLRRTGFMDERRTGNAQLETSVDTALQMRRSDGRRAARCYLEQASVPESIIRRVLSHTAQRRKTRLASEEGEPCCIPPGDLQTMTG